MNVFGLAHRENKGSDYVFVFPPFNLAHFFVLFSLFFAFSPLIFAFLIYLNEEELYGHLRSHKQTRIQISSESMACMRKIMLKVIMASILSEDDMRGQSFYGANVFLCW